MSFVVVGLVEIALTAAIVVVAVEAGVKVALAVQRMGGKC